MDRRGAGSKREPTITRAQLDELEQRLRPVIAKILDEPQHDTTVAITCTPVTDDPDGASVLRFEVRIRGEEISPEQEQKVAQLLRSSGDPNIVKTKPRPPGVLT